MELRRGVAGEIQRQFSKAEDRPWCLYSGGKDRIEQDSNGIGKSREKCPREGNDKEVKDVSTVARRSGGEH